MHDRFHVGLGGEFVAGDFYRRYWDGQLISGVFNERTSVRGAEFIRQRVHFLGFVDEKEFGNGQFARATQFIANPFLFRDGTQAQAAMENWPLHPAELINSR